ncbi:hypothetical protein HNQ60_002082 [Povalibacter uvarum]|uniref:CENP-V/GFA domain-containing protein n=1 Tax=Povalibacter uvarum TaxID=732238 RepID=A0A841HKU9_9GAMM|nr:hypothetical protein [Povalibacter uvarum]MBB6093204.1 hypothetical protein [Povalibacter uvarum]
MEIAGRCHCGNISFLFTITPDPIEIAARACSCSFCVKHGGVWTSSPSGSLSVTVRSPAQVSRYSFGTRTADFHVCTACGVVPLVTSRIEDREYAVVSVNAFEGVPESMLRRASASFDGEGQGERLERRARNWIPDVTYASS